MNRGEIWWAELDQPTGSGPGFKRPVLIIQSDDFNRRKDSGLPKDSVINISQIITIDKSFLEEQTGELSKKYLKQVEKGLKLVLSL